MDIKEAKTKDLIEETNRRLPSEAKFVPTYKSFGGYAKIVRYELLEVTALSEEDARLQLLDKAIRLFGHEAKDGEIDITDIWEGD